MNSKIPKNAVKVFKGKVWDVYQWKEVASDGKEVVIEGLKRKNTSRILAVLNNKIILTKETDLDGKIFYNVLGGTIEEREKPIEAAKRELLEESGLVSEDWELLEKIDVINLPRVEFYSYIYIAKNCIKNSNQKLDPTEKIELAEVNFDEGFKLLSKNGFNFGRSVFINNKNKIKELKAKLGLN